MQFQKNISYVKYIVDVILFIVAVIVAVVSLLIILKSREKLSLTLSQKHKRFLRREMRKLRLIEQQQKVFNWIGKIK